ncbi:MFS general substrate transporter [Coniochaeta ligniaria NRRL 30616]|uniref:MFS general substrate transporter n=1 Tax=Coniochaeta ligniaria NRRL 30616 TaxID=1408157 RepID=A0A1J7JZD1_9PEZI|nr:MFS general substrate transporter [Coniochaeta ligniaria NRRL 30616]
MASIELAPVGAQDYETGSPASTGDTVPEDALAQNQGSRQDFSLPPVDGGKDAWFFLAACFMLEGLVWDFPFAFGVFQDYYSTTAPFAGSASIAVIGTCAMGIMYLDVPLTIAFLRLYPRLGRWAPIAGLLIMCLGLAMSSFSTSVTHLIVTQGVFYAIGGSIAYTPCIVYMDEWFVKKKGLAYGIMWSGTGLAGVVLPLLLQSLLDRYGFKTTLRLWAVVVFVLTAPLAYYIKPRLPYSAVIHTKPFDVRFVFTRTFAVYQIANVAEAFGFFLPGIYLPSYARSTLGASGALSALTILLVNVASVFGCVAMGSLIDRLDVTTCILISTLGATVGTFLLWGLASSLPVLYVFCVVYGLFAGSFTSAWTGIMKEVAKRGEEDESNTRRVDPSMVFAFLAAGRGVGNVASGPLSEVLVKGLPWQGKAAAGYGSGFGTLIVFTGVTALVGGGSFLWKRIGWL